jgi:hypothetical protein
MEVTKNRQKPAQKDWNPKSREQVIKSEIQQKYIFLFLILFSLVTASTSTA